MKLSSLIYLIFNTNMLLDDKKSCDFDTMRSHINCGDLFDWMGSEYKIDFSIINHESMREERGQIIGALRLRLESQLGREGRKLGVQNNGLCLLIALTVDVISANRISIAGYEEFYGQNIQ
jgi:hypothetical protein